MSTHTKEKKKKTSRNNRKLSISKKKEEEIRRLVKRKLQLLIQVVLVNQICGLSMHRPAQNNTPIGLAINCVLIFSFLNTSE